MSDTKTAAEILAALGKPFPRNAVKQRQGGRGMMFDYIETHTIIHRLNTATDGNWSWVVKSTDWRGDLLIVQGELTIPPVGTRAAFGVQKVSDRGGEDLVKGANSDALKKAATMFGVALDLYGSDYEAQAAPQAPQQPRSTPKPANASQAPPPANIDRERAMSRLHAVGNQHGIDHEGLRRITVETARAENIAITSMTEAPQDIIVKVANSIEKKPDAAKSWLAKQQELMPSPEDVPNPDRHTY